MRNLNELTTDELLAIARELSWSIEIHTDGYTEVHVSTHSGDATYYDCISDGCAAKNVLKECVKAHVNGECEAVHQIEDSPTYRKFMERE